MLFLLLSLITLLIVAALSFELTKGQQSIPALRNAPFSEKPNWPLISIVIAARDEEKNIKEAVESMLTIDYPNKEVIVVNDRSTDGTANILAELASNNTALSVITIASLPTDWLGKNHAHWVGAKAAQGDYLLFTDADVVMEKSILKRAVDWTLNNQLDHLTMIPNVRVPGAWLNMFMVGFAVFFNLYARPWRARNPKSRYFVGIGAFNFLRRSTYEAIGTHEAIRMRPDDDMKLGELVKQKGFKQHFLYGQGLMHVEWYASVKELVNGLMKNTYAGLNYNIWLVVAATLTQLVFVILPFIAVFFTSGLVFWIYTIIIALYLANGAQSATHQQLPLRLAFGFPIAATMLLYILWKATFKTIHSGGISWRGTFYSLKDLKKNS